MIALDTGHLVYNYGTKLQAYAMQHLLEQSGEKVEIIQWHKKNFGLLNAFSESIRKPQKIIKRYPVKYWHRISKRYNAIDSFNSKFHIHKFYGTFEDMKSKTSIYSQAFCGSDQAWLPGNVVNHWYTLEFFDSRNTFKTAYAPSFGIDYIEDKYVSKYQRFLGSFDSISVREISGQKIIKDLLDKDVPVVLDPTLVIRREVWDELKGEATYNISNFGKYMFCYFLGSKKEHRNAVKKYSKENGLKIVNMSHFSSYCEADEGFADIDVYSASPQDFLLLIDNAEKVCTDSFHCTAFSIQFHKDFTAFSRFSNDDRASTNTRLYSLLSQLDLEKRLFAQDKQVIDEHIDYSAVDLKLNELRAKSIAYLKSALEKTKNV